MLKLFIKYTLVGGLNTLIHWVSFAGAYYLISLNQMLSNFIGFCIAVTFSFFVNAKWTFESEQTAIKYFMYVGFMGAVAMLFGYIGDKMALNPIFTLISFSAISLFIGFLYSKFIVFRSK